VFILLLSNQEETQQQLFKELKLKVLLIENFVPPSEKLKLLSRIGYDEEEDSWKLTQVIFVCFGSCTYRGSRDRR
jgi:hypothetical protein